ncbi:organic acid transporter NDAI_0A07850 [Naumovozyma dairenensis CBS 421]|uniref:Carrier protein YMC1, mitochondrial n=1 Tax=Naumovozyma dairenensis (strain ATCC 10597 / BCRC 20456 / CBS 421 / NBRC 0211 / NRRL Y-12639) TaxID=1071378 RepID=G0W551_NAUDC|nr:hypothetical protein NDAI_0A07850 [Naumovozyma dairenensis CBS 421]CCD22939.1 hypothetical protein NDAI_0A07850 [Naumovozyma dairenensis CBS 421]
MSTEDYSSPQLIDEDPMSLKPDPEHKHNRTTRVLKDILAGTCGGISQVIVGQPFDTTKVRMQTSTSQSTTAKEIISKLIKNEGLMGFYKGSLIPIVGVGACVSVQFGVNEAMKRFFHQANGTNARGNDTLSLKQYYICGLTGGVINSFLSSPIEHVRIRLQTQTGIGKPEFNGPIDCIRKLLKEKSLMRGLRPMMLRAGHGLGCYFLTYEALIARDIKKGMDRCDISAWKLCTYGSLSGTVLWLSIYPLDVVKSMIQTDTLRNPKFNNSMRKVITHLYRTHGISSFFKGFVPTMLRAAPVNGATFVTFECIMRVLG